MNFVGIRATLQWVSVGRHPNLGSKSDVVFKVLGTRVTSKSYMSKRTVSQRLAEQSASASDEPSPRSKHPRLESNSNSHPDSQSLQFLQYPDTSKHINKQTPFQQPTQLISFSYNSSHTLEFNDSALRYYVDPPPRAKLSYGYERWIRKPDGRARIDGLLQAFAKARETSDVPLHDVGVVAWRGVITRYVN